MADHLELLLNELNRLRSSTTDATRSRQIREGVELAVRLADLLQKIANREPRHAARRLIIRPLGRLAPCLLAQNPYNPRFRSIPAGS